MLLIKEIPRKFYFMVWIFQILFAFCWFLYIFGVLGHVCPVAFLGMWNASLIGAVAFFGKRPSFSGCFFSLIITAGCFGLSYFVFHPFDSDNLVRYVNTAPFIFLGLSAILSVFAQGISIKMPERVSKQWELMIERAMEYFFVIILTIIGIGYVSFPSIKEGMYIEPPDVTEWFDTVFYRYDVYYLFLFLVVQALICNILIICGIYYEQSKIKNQHRALLLKVSGFSFLGFLLLGTWATFHLLGQESNVNEKN